MDVEASEESEAIVASPIAVTNPAVSQEVTTSAEDGAQMSVDSISAQDILQHSEQSAQDMQERAADVDAGDDADNTQQDEIDVAKALEERQQRAEQELRTFLANKGVDPEKADDFRIIVTLSKSKKRRNSNALCFSITYSKADESAEQIILASKTDVLNEIMQATSTRNAGSTNEDGPSPAELREAAHKKNKEALDAIIGEVPVEIDGIRVLSFGKIHPSPSFHNAVQLYPVGYTCELSILGVAGARGPTKQTLHCEIKEVDGEPEFCITNRETGMIYWCNTELGAWKKVRHSPSRPKPFTTAPPRFDRVVDLVVVRHRSIASVFPVPFLTALLRRPCLVVPPHSSITPLPS